MSYIGYDTIGVITNVAKNFRIGYIISSGSCSVTIAVAVAVAVAVVVIILWLFVDDCFVVRTVAVFAAAARIMKLWTAYIRSISS